MTVSADRRRCGPRARVTAILLTLALSSGCVTTEISSSASIVPPAPGSSPPALGTGSQTSVVVAPLCAIPYDGFSLPLVSPDGKFVATQTGVAPEWPSLLAGMTARRPLASGIEVWELSGRDGKKVNQLPRGFILGSSCDASGFLIEDQLEDGSRRIGRVRWPGQTIANSDGSLSMVDDLRPEWLVDDGRVNAFAALGPDGSLAWCAREVNQPTFALAVRLRGESFEILDNLEWSWMLPVFADDGRSLFAMRVRDGVTELVHGDPTDEDSFRQSMQATKLSLRCDQRRAWQSLAPQSTSSAVSPGEDSRLVFFHPDLRRMAIWDPGKDSIEPLEDGSFAAAIALDGSLVVSDPDGILVQPPGLRRGKPPRIYDRMAIPRRVDTAPDTWILLVPDRRSINVVRLTLVQPPRVAG